MRYVIANWKMYPTPSRAATLLTRIQDGLRHEVRDGLTVIVCPPYVALMRLRGLLDPRVVRLGAQNCHWQAEGPYTGEVSPTMLAGVADYVLLGHSERRAAGETDVQIAMKVSAAAAAGLIPVLFVGEDEPSDAALDESRARLERGLAEVDLAAHRVLVVYEPTWAVGGDRAADPERVRDVVRQLKERLKELGSGEPEVIYGGTVSPDNVEQFTAIEILDGVGATRASLDERRFLRIVDRVAAAPR